MKWTKKMPTHVGFYWFRGNAKPARVVEVYQPEDTPDLWCSCDKETFHWKVSTASHIFNGYWSDIPVQVPQEVYMNELLKLF